MKHNAGGGLLFPEHGQPGDNCRFRFPAGIKEIVG